MILKSTRGSEWRKWDLHIHTPSSYDYKDKSITNEDFINKLSEEKVSAVAITDHHVIDIERIKKLQELGKEKNIVVFPGIEFLSDARGSEPIHIIGIFSNEGNLEYIWSQLQARTNISRIQGEGKKENEVYCNLPETVQLIHDLGGIVTIHAGHKSNSMETIPHTIPHGDAQKNDIAGIVDVFEVAKEKDVADYKNFVNPAIEKSIGKKLPIIICSDNHDIKNYEVRQNCWVKANLTFEGLKQIIYEPEDRVRVQAAQPEQKSDYQIIDSIEFNNNAMGTQKIIFNQNLNTVIGGRSSGKSILLGCLATSIDSSITAKENTKYNEKYNHLVKSLNKKAIVTWRDKTSKPRKIIYYSQSSISERVRPDEYGISGINELVQDIIKKDNDKSQELQKYDSVLGANRTEINTKINDFTELQNQIEDKITQIADIGNKSGIILEIEKIQNEIESIKKNIVGYLTEEEDKKYKRSKEQVVKNEQKIRILKTDIDQLNIAIKSELFVSIDPLLSTFSPETKEEIVYFYDNLKTETKEKWKNFLNSQIEFKNTEVSDISEKLNEIVNSELYKKGESFQFSNEQLASKENSLKEEKEKKYKIDKLEQEIKELNNAKKNCIESLWSLFEKYNTYSSYLADILTIQKDEVEIKTKSTFLYKDFFEVALDSLNRKEKNVKKYDVFEEKNNEERIKWVKEIFDGIVNGKLPLKKDLRQTLINLFSNNYYKLSYDVTFDGDSFETMSEGKKAFIALRLLLDFDDSKCPIIIDQPEDDLDNRAIYDKLVEYLRKQKKNRQIILATHNPNVVVGADAELVLVANQNGLENKNQDNLQFEYYGNGIEDTFENKECDTILLSKGVREHICEILEGGNIAFQIREKKYGYKVD